MFKIEQIPVVFVLRLGHESPVCTTEMFARLLVLHACALACTGTRRWSCCRAAGEGPGTVAPGLQAAHGPRNVSGPPEPKATPVCSLGPQEGLRPLGGS